MKNYMAIDQYGSTEHSLGPYPRKELLDRYGRKRASKIYIDKTDGSSIHIGWIIAGRWFTVYEVKRMERRKGR